MMTRCTILMCLLLMLIVAFGHFVSSAGQGAETISTNATWQASHLANKSDACLQNRQLEHVSSVLDGGQGRRSTSGSIGLVSSSRPFLHELLTGSEQRLRQQYVGQQAPLQVLQCSWLI